MFEKQKSSIFLNKLKSLSRQDLLEIKGIGEVLTQNFLDFTNSSRFQKLVEEFENLEKQGLGLEIESEKIMANKSLDSNKILYNQIVCITGSFEISRDKIKEKLEELGAKVSDSINSKTTILLAGQNAGSKLEKARIKQIKIINSLENLSLKL